VLDGDESDVDCGGSCRTCADGHTCNTWHDCWVGSGCAAGTCVPGIPCCPPENPACGVVCPPQNNICICTGDECSACDYTWTCTYTYGQQLPCQSPGCCIP
jgi:hypothetical protein